MNIVDLIKKSLDAGVFLYVENEQLKFKLTKGAFPEVLKTELIAHKREIIQFLQSKSDAYLVEKPSLEVMQTDQHQTVLSCAQNRMWFLDSSKNGAIEYNMQAVFDVCSGFDHHAAQSAINALIKRHEILRTVYVETTSGVRQTVLQDYTFNLTQEVLPVNEKEVLVQQLKSIIDNDFNQPFDLEKDIMIRGTFVSINANTCPDKLILNIHHIASDGWSEKILLNEFHQFYHFYTDGITPNLIPLELQYKDYAVWQRTWLSDQMLEDQLGYWEGQLLDAPMVHNVPLDFSRPKTKSIEGQHVLGHISSKTVKALTTFAHMLNMTPFMVVHAALSLLVARHSNINDIIIGTPMANRTERELAPLIGCFANTLVLRTKTNFSSVKDYLFHVRKVNLDAQRNQDVPFEQIVEKCNVPRSSQHTPMFQIMLEMDNTDNAVTIANPVLELNELNQVAAKFDLELSIQLGSEGGVLNWLYDTSLFTQQRIEIFNSHFVTLLEAMIGNSEGVLSQLPMLHDDEVQDILGLNINPAPEYPTSLYAHELFEAQVTLSPDKVALELNNVSMTYRELDEKANQLANFLRSKYPNSHLIGLCMERSSNMWVSILGILKSGAGYVPLDPTYPKDRLIHMLNDSNIQHLITSDKAIALAELSESLETVNLDCKTIQSMLNCESREAPIKLKSQAPDDAAYVIYTSGSTGLPKGIVQTHQTVSNLIQGMVVQDGVGRPLRTLQLSSISFDISIQESFTAWHTGGTLVLIDDSQKADLFSLPKIIEQMNIERLYMTPAVLNWMAGSLLEDGKRLPMLRHISVAGDTLILSDSIRDFLNGHKECKLWNQYGPSESHVMTSGEIKASDQKVYLGQIMPNTELYVVGSDGNILPKGVAGEAYIGGLCLAKGYLNNPDMTAEKFIPHPFKRQSSERLYRSGDIVRITNNNQIEFIERIDHQVKIRGFRVELGEVEHKLSQLEIVSSCIVQAQKDKGGHNHLVAYVHPNSSLQEDIKALSVSLKEYLKQHLPHFMIPSAIVVLEDWPRTTNGKIDKKALPKPNMLVNQGDFVAPTTVVESKLTEIWGELLGLPKDQISATANFFEIGGHSLLTIKLISLIRATWQVELNVHQVFEAADLNQLAAKVDEQRRLATQANELLVSNSNKSSSLVV